MGRDPLRVLFQGHLFKEITVDAKHTIYFSVYFAISTKINCGIEVDRVGEQVVLKWLVKAPEY